MGEQSVAPAKAGAAGAGVQPPDAPTFVGATTKLAGLAGALLGWRPDEFWTATPAELAAVLDALAPAPATAGAGELLRLKEMFPDG